MGKFLYYSTQCLLAHRIAEKYFGKHYYAFCAEEFNPSKTNPISSNPAKIYQLYKDIVETNDINNDRAVNLKLKLAAVALDKFLNHHLTQSEYDELTLEIDQARALDFAPILYLILREKVAQKLETVSNAVKGNPNSIEYLIRELVEDDFEMIVPPAWVGGHL